ncbi:MAG: CBS and ACT domain-containing protein [Pseudomonadota bacterium]
MLVKNWMSKNVVTVDGESTIVEAMKLMKEHQIKRLPVTKKGKLAGIITDGDIKKASPSEATTLEAHELAYLISSLKVKTIMTSPVVTVASNRSIVEAAEELMSNKVTGAPVLDDKENIVGMISMTDLTKLLITLTGVGPWGIEMGLLVKDEPGSIQALADVIRSHGGRVRSLLTLYENVPEGFRKVFFRIYEFDRQKLTSLKNELGKKARLLYLVDHLQATREIYDN